MVVGARVTDTPFNVKFPPNKRPEESFSPHDANDDSFPKALTAAPRLSKQLPPLKHQRTIPDLLKKDKSVDKNNLIPEDEQVWKQSCSKHCLNYLTLLECVFHEDFQIVNVLKLQSLIRVHSGKFCNMAYSASLPKVLAFKLLTTLYS